MFIINSNIPHRVANELLHILKKNGHIELPNDVRCLLGTPRNVSSHIQSFANGRYIHFGFSSLERSIQTYSTLIQENKVTLYINIDGLSLCKSSGSQLWPIMGSIEEIDVYTIYYRCISWYIQARKCK